MPKNPFYADKVVLKDGGVIETSDGTAIIEVDENGTPSIKADISEALAYGSIYIGDSAGVTSELAIGASGYVLTSNGTTAAWAEGGVPSGTTITATNDTSAGAILNFMHDSASPAEGDGVAAITGIGNDAGGDPLTYGGAIIGIDDIGAGTEAGFFGIGIAQDGVFDSSKINFAVYGGGGGFSAYDEGVEGVEMEYLHVTASIAANDKCASLLFGIEDTVADDIIGFAHMDIIASDVTQGAEEGELHFYLMSGGNNTSPTFTLQGDHITVQDNVGMAFASTNSITATSEGVAASGIDVVTYITTNGDQDEDNVTLANGSYQGQIKQFIVVAVGNANDSVSITPATMLGGTKITFAASPLGLGCHMLWNGSAWGITGNNGGTVS
jgi:hypothetical protein